MYGKKLFSLAFAVSFTAFGGIVAFAANEITMERAAEIALAKTGGGIVTECNLDYDDGRKAYDIEIINGNTKYEMEIGVTDSQIYDYSEKSYTNYDQAGKNEITEEKAKTAALEKAGGGVVWQCKLDFEDDRKIYEIDIVNGEVRHEMDVSATNGTILKHEQKTVADYHSSISGNTEITAEKAKEIALGRTGGGAVVQCKTDYEHGRKVYEIEIINGGTKYELDVCATDSKIYDYEQDKMETEDYNSTAAGRSIISADQAKALALAKTGGGIVGKCELDDDDGRPVYEIEIVNGQTEYEMEIDAIDGKIYDFDVDYDD